MNTGAFLRKYAYMYIYVVGGFLLAGYLIGGNALPAHSPQSFSERPTIIVDAGHGGIDGGTTSCTGVKESQINLEISQRLDRILALFGYRTVMVRREDVSVATEGSTIREQKRSDLRNRVELVNGTASALYVSIHQNSYPQQRYSGPQVFYSDHRESQTLAQNMQEKLNRFLKPGSKRSCKPADGIYIMGHIRQPGILIECGFLSNPQEEEKLRTPSYQKRVCAIIAATVADYLEGTAAV